MKILLHDTTPAYLAHGGKQVHAQMLYENLSSLGVDVEYARWWDPHQKCDLIHCFGCSPKMVNLAHKAGIKVILTHIVDSMTNASTATQTYHYIRNRMIRNFTPGGVLRLFPWHIFPRFDALVYMHKYDAEAAIKIYGVPRDKTSIIPHGCSASEMARLREGPHNKRSHLVSVGSIIPRKNSVLLAKAALQTNTPVVFLGKPFSDDDQYFQKFMSLVDGKYVIYPGYVSEKEKVQLLTNASGFVLPSLAESGCIAVYEAAAAGLPMLLADLPWAHIYGNHSMVQHVNLGNNNTFPRKLQSFFHNSTRLDGPTFPVMTWKEVAEEYTRVYKSVLRITT